MNVELRKWRMDDASNLTEILSNKKIWDNLRDIIPFPYTEKDATEFISSVQEDDNQFVFAITVDGKVVGCIGITRQEDVHRRTAELGYYLAEEYWGNGIVSEAVRQICEYIFTNTDIIRIFAVVYDFNTGSAKVLEKNGFTYEGTLRANAIKNGKVRDSKMYSLLKTDKNSLNASPS